MITDEKLTAILSAIQIDPGNRGLARDPKDNLFTACPGDFVAACRSIATHHNPALAMFTGFFIPTADTPAFETDGPLGACFIKRAFSSLGISCGEVGESPVCNSIYVGYMSQLNFKEVSILRPGLSHILCIERSGPSADGKHYTMRGSDVSSHHRCARYFADLCDIGESVTIGIGDGGNEIGMGKIPHETIVKNIPNGDLIHCRVPADHLIVAGVSNWGAYALAAGVFVLRGVEPPTDLFDPDREREILEIMVREGPLVDGVTGKQTATVDGLTWDEYVKPLIRIREILEQ